MGFKLNKALFIEKANKLHSNKFNYDKVIYINIKTKVIIICNNCKLNFLQRPLDHLKPNGCPVCSKRFAKRKDSSGNSLIPYKSFEERKQDFILKCKIMHNNIYCYDNINFINSETKIKINCKEHGYFEQTPQHHLRGQGCPTCGNNKKCGIYAYIFKYKPNFKCFIYYIKLINKDGLIFYKIGLAVNPKRRFQEFKNLNCEVLETYQGEIKDLYPLEQEYHKAFKEMGIQYIPEELKGNGATECFKW